MAVRGEEVASSIESHVRGEIERMVGEIRSSIDDVRVAVDQQLKAALQSVQADVNSLSFLPHIQKQIGELESGMEPAAPAAPPQAAAVQADASRLKRAIQSVEAGKSQVDILNALLEQSLEFGSRAALLILKGETFSGWKGVGFSAHGGNDELVKRFNAAPGLLPELDQVLRQEQVVIWDGANLATRLGVAASSRAVLVPMVIKDKVAAAVYVDAVEDDVAKLDASSIEVLVFTTGLLIDTLSIRKKVPSPSLSGGGESTAAAHAPAAPQPAPAPPPRAAAPAPAPPAAPKPAAPPPPTPPVRPPAPVPAATPHPESTVAITADQMRQMMATSAPSFNVPSADEFTSSSANRPAPPPPPTPNAFSTTMIPAMTEPPAAAAPPPVAPAESERPSTQFIPPSGISRGGALGGEKSEEAKKHDEARRFARLLVSEIKLYNETKVDQGRKNKDLYERLKEDIDRSRQMYDERIGEDVRKASNYFYDELVRILADGEAEALGL